MLRLFCRLLCIAAWLPATGLTSPARAQPGIDLARHPLHRAARDGDLATLNRLLKSSRGRINDVVEGVGSPLQAAVGGRSGSAVKVLLRAGAQVDRAGGGVPAPVLAATLRGRPAVLELLLAAKPKLDVVDSQGRSVLTQALELIDENPVDPTVAAGRGRCLELLRAAGAMESEPDPEKTGIRLRYRGKIGDSYTRLWEDPDTGTKSSETRTLVAVGGGRMIWRISGAEAEFEAYDERSRILVGPSPEMLLPDEEPELLVPSFPSQRVRLNQTWTSPFSIRGQVLRSTCRLQGIEAADGHRLIVIAVDSARPWDGGVQLAGVRLRVDYETGLLFDAVGEIRRPLDVDPDGTVLRFSSSRFRVRSQPSGSAQTCL